MTAPLISLTFALGKVMLETFLLSLICLYDFHVLRSVNPFQVNFAFGFLIFPG